MLLPPNKLYLTRLYFPNIKCPLSYCSLREVIHNSSDSRMRYYNIYSIDSKSLTISIKVRLEVALHSGWKTISQFCNVFSINPFCSCVKKQKSARQVITTPVGVTTAPLRTFKIHHDEVHSINWITVEALFNKLQTTF